MRGMRAINTDKLTERSVYGLIITATLLITLEHYEDSSWDMIVTILLTLMAVAVAERYAELFAYGLGKNSHDRWREFSDMPRDYLYLLYGSAAPTLLFLLSGIGVITLLSAFNYAELVAALLFVLYGYAFGQKRGRTKLTSLLYGLANFGVVAIIVLFKSIAHV
jgi:hypothetical protein